MNADQVREALKQVKYPGYSRDIVSFGIVKDIRVEGGRCAVSMELTSSDPKASDEIRRASEAVLRALPGIQQVEVAMGMKAAATVTPRRPGLENIRRSLAVASGKGGVGKSTVAVNLALTLAKLGGKTGLLDCDIYGPSIPLMMRAHEAPEMQDGKIVPVESHGIKLMSIGFLMDPDAPVIWRGPLIAQAIQQFLFEVAWGPLDWLVIDLPPGTGDAQLSLCQALPLTGAVMVTTPQEVALLDVRKASAMFKKVNVPILGVVENMSFFLCPSDGKRYEIFGSGGGEREARRLGVPLLAQVPIEMAVREGGDQGSPIVVASPDSASAKAFLAAAQMLEKQLPATAP
ncbi:MAG: Mrp/NBP35 family ATP-binding protein [Verrucomicrobiae bacterium]|nr:Mrp/NBP35 family ATP-binding protein [Verrucomicrobiae bacterium]